jgi:TonB family protein
MYCRDIASLLDERRIVEWSEEEKAVAERHAASCEDCADALASVRALQMDPIPVMPIGLDPLLLVRAAPARAQHSSRPKRRTVSTGRLVSIIGLGSFALAAAGFVAYEFLADESAVPRARRAGSDDDRTTVMSRPATGEDSPALEFIEAAEREALEEFGESVLALPSLPDGEMLRLLTSAPVYPADAAAAGLEGYAVAEFTVNEDGNVVDIGIVESSHDVFEQSTLDAVSRVKYKPRIVNGQAVSVDGIRLRFGYRLDSARLEAPEQRESEAAPEQPEGMSVIEFRALLDGVANCLDAGDLQCAELRLDYIGSTAELSATQQSEIARIYGFLYYRQGSYERAIDAYRDAAGILGNEGGYFHAMPLMIIAHIYYERHQYQQAFDYALEYLRAAPNPRLADYGGGRGR